MGWSLSLACPAWGLPAPHMSEGSLRQAYHPASTIQAASVLVTPQQGPLREGGRGLVGGTFWGKRKDWSFQGPRRLGSLGVKGGLCPSLSHTITLGLYS